MIANTRVDQTVEILILDLLEWLDAQGRTYEEVMEIWGTSCPRLPIWEEANTRGFVMRERANGSEVIHLTSSGVAVLRKYRFLKIMRNYLKAVC